MEIYEYLYTKEGYHYGQTMRDKAKAYIEAKDNDSAEPLVEESHEIAERLYANSKTLL